MHRKLHLFGLVLLVGVTFAQEEATTVVVPEILDVLDSAENTVESEGNSELIELISKVSSHFANNGELKRFRSNYWENWVAPYNISQKFPFYLSGYDEEDRPIWICEFGRWDIRGIVEGGNDTLNAFEKYVYQAIYRIYRSFVERSTVGHPVTEFNAILDFEDYSLTQAASPSTVVFVLGLLRRFNEIVDRHLGHAYFINVNYVAERFVTLMRPVVGSIAERWDVYGTRKDKWVHALRNHFPKDQLPEWYGGKKGFVPVRIFG